MDESGLEKQHTQIRNIAKELQIEIPNSEIEELATKFNRLVHMAQGTPNASLVPDQKTYFRNEMQRENEKKQKIYEGMAIIKLLLPEAKKLYQTINPDASEFYSYDDSSFEAMEKCFKSFRKVNLVKIIHRFKLIIEKFNSEQSPTTGQSCILLGVKEAGNNKEAYYFRGEIVGVSKKGLISLKGEHGGAYVPEDVFTSTQQAIEYRPDLTLYKYKGTLNDFRHP